ncbi:Elongation factor 4 [Nymphon striatum]|nr:Elongation factor 4 [Nymphon striatum]
MKDQMLDSMDIERERGITIKAQTVRIDYTADDGEDYVLNLIDTPGHVDFAYEGVEAQTLANVYHAIEADHEIVPVLNKIDLPAADCDRVAEQIEDVIGIDATDAIQVLWKPLLPACQPPRASATQPLKAMLVDSWYDSYLGVIVLVRIIDGVLKRGERIKMLSNGSTHHVDRIGVFKPELTNIDELGPGELGFLTASIKQVRDTRVGDTITHEKKGTDEALDGFKPSQPVVFCGLFPVDSAQFEDLRDAIEKLALNDASFSFEMETSAALGFGFRCGFLGLLHLEVIRDRIEREYDIDLITTAPSVIYHVYMRAKDGEVGEKIDLHNPADMPDLTHVDHLEEPRIKATILVPDEYLGDVLKLCQDRRGIQEDLTYAGTRAMVVYDLPLNEVVFDFYDRLKSVTKGYASFDYQMTGYRQDRLVKMQILVNDEPVDALSIMVHHDRAEARGRAMVEKLKDLIPRHMFKIPIQAAIGGRIIARETLAAMRKDVTAKCYGGDATRKKKLLEKQKAGKKKMRQFGKVDIPQEAFISALKMDS